jgi:hypothetical protein
MMASLRAGDAVEVRSKDEILATLDSKGALEGLPFMPEMLKYCGQQYKIYKRADKTGQYSNFPGYGSRRMFNTVFLEGLRCDGEHHDECDALCLLYWKEAWLKKSNGNVMKVADRRENETIGLGKSQRTNKSECTLDMLFLSTKVPKDASGKGKERYSCQLTEVMKASSELKWWDFRQYYRDLYTRNISLKYFAKWASIAILNWVHQKVRGYRIYPFIDKRLLLRGEIPHEILNLQVGDVVQIKSLEEILQTLDVNMKNKGLMFTKELIPYCGKTSKVIKVVKKSVYDVNGEMIYFPTNCILLEDVICTGTISDKRLFCQKSCYPFWREIWLRKI